MFEVHGPLGEALLNGPPFNRPTVGLYSIKELLALRRQAYESINPDIRASWDRHFKGKYNRDAGFPYRLGLGSPKTPDAWGVMLVDVMREGDCPCFATARHYGGKLLDSNEMSLDTLFLDFDDGEHPEKALRDAGLAYDFFSAKYDCEPRLLYSGSKGAHLLIDLPEPKVESRREVKVGTLVSFKERVIEPLKLVTLDGQVPGDLVRMERIANTRHQKTGYWCIPLRREELDWDISRLRELAMEPRIEPVESRASAYLLGEALEEIGAEVWAKVQLQDQAEKRERKARMISRELGLNKPRRIQGSSSERAEHCPGITAALEGVGENSRHLSAFGLTAFWLHIGDFSPEKLRQWNKVKNQPPLDDKAMNEVIARKDPGHSFCYFFNLAGLCPADCEKLK
jgi:hypothetical protein